jgi:beta-galactosidase
MGCQKIIKKTMLLEVFCKIVIVSQKNRIDKQRFLWQNNSNGFSFGKECPKGGGERMANRFFYHQDLDTLHVGCDKPRAYFIPYGTRAAARTGNRAVSDRFLTLCGEWSFHYYKSLHDVEDFTAAEWSGKGGERLDVPMCWQMALGRGYDVPNYLNNGFQISVDPPYVPDDNPCGLYERTFELDAETLNSRCVKLVFEGVSSCFYVYVNDQFVAYSQVSHSMTEISLDGALVAGKNSIKVLVVKWCDGT